MNISNYTRFTLTLFRWVTFVMTLLALILLGVTAYGMAMHYRWGEEAWNGLVFSSFLVLL